MYFVTVKLSEMTKDIKTNRGILNTRDVTIHRCASVPDLNVYDASASVGRTPTDSYVTFIGQKTEHFVGISVFL